MSTYHWMSVSILYLCNHCAGEHTPPTSRLASLVVGAAEIETTVARMPASIVETCIIATGERLLMGESVSVGVGQWRIGRFNGGEISAVGILATAL